MQQPSWKIDLSPDDQQDDFPRQLRDDYGTTFLGAKRLPDGSYALMARLFTTTAIHLGVDPAGWSRRFCYDNLAECLHAWEKLQTRADTPEGFIARRPELGEL